MKARTRRHRSRNDGWLRHGLWSVALAVVSACTDEPQRHTPNANTDVPDSSAILDPTDTDTPGALSFVVAPQVEQNPNDVAPRVWILTAQTSAPTQLEVSVDASEGTRTLRFPQVSTEHDVSLLDLGFDEDVTVRVTAIADTLDAQIHADPIVVYVPPPRSLRLAVEISRPELMEPGFTLVSSGDKLAALDSRGRAVWTWGPDPRRARAQPLLAYRTDDGRIRMLMAAGDKADRQVVEIDERGNELARWGPAKDATPPTLGVDLPLLHHDVQAGPGDSLLTLSVVGLHVDEFPQSETDRGAGLGPADLAVDVVAEFDRDGTVTRGWALADLLDVKRIGYDSLSTGHWEDVLGPAVHDWSHGNAVLYDRANDAILVSARHQDAVISFDPDSGQLNWILASHNNWGPAQRPYLLEPLGAEFGWFYHQHAPELTPQGTLLLFDNHNHGASPTDPAVPNRNLRSRVVEYRIDHDAMTVEQVWSWGEELEVFSSMQGDADSMPTTGNVLVLYGGIWKPGDDVVARIYEVTGGPDPEIVFQVGFTDGSSRYRGERIPTLYPPGVEVL